jgi:hypothetical protein
MPVNLENSPEDDARERRRAAEYEVNLVLGDRLLIPIQSMQEYGGPSPPTLYRAEQEGLIALIRNGRRTFLTRAQAKVILIDGLGKVSFVYGKQYEERLRATGDEARAARRAQLVKQAAVAREAKRAKKVKEVV